MVDTLFVGIRWLTTGIYRLARRLFYLIYPVIYLFLLMTFACFRCLWEALAVTSRWPGSFASAWHDRQRCRRLATTLARTAQPWWQWHHRPVGLEATGGLRVADALPAQV